MSIQRTILKPFDDNRIHCKRHLMSVSPTFDNLSPVSCYLIWIIQFSYRTRPVSDCFIFALLFWLARIKIQPATINSFRMDCDTQKKNIPNLTRLDLRVRFDSIKIELPNPILNSNPHFNIIVINIAFVVAHETTV